jgi:hypothetical protein
MVVLPGLYLFDARSGASPAAQSLLPPTYLRLLSRVPYERKEVAAAMSESRERIERALDEALEESFPASDPVSIVTSEYEEDWGEEVPKPGTQAPAAPAKEPSAPG